MNLLPCEVKGGEASFAGHRIATGNAQGYSGNGGKLEIGVRP